MIPIYTFTDLLWDAAKCVLLAAAVLILAFIV